MDYALDSSAKWFVNYSGDGTPAGDSAARIASAGMTQIEGGDREMGARLVDQALLRGVPDPQFYQDGMGYARMLRDKALCERVVRLAQARFPQRSWSASDCMNTDGRSITIVGAAGRVSVAAAGPLLHDMEGAQRPRRRILLNGHSTTGR